jgi:hypothetical protein
LQKPFFILKLIDMKKLSIHVLLVSLLLSVASLNCGTSSSLMKEGSQLMSALGGVPNLSQFTNLLKTPGLSKAIGGVLKKPFTLLAPTNDALTSAGGSALSGLSSDVSKLAGMVKNLIIPGKKDATSIMESGLKTANGNPLNLGGVNLGSLISGDKYNVIPVDKVPGQ